MLQSEGSQTVGHNLVIEGAFVKTILLLIENFIIISSWATVLQGDAHFPQNSPQAAPLVDW